MTDTELTKLDSQIEQLSADIEAVRDEIAPLETKFDSLFGKRKRLTEKRDTEKVSRMYGGTGPDGVDIGLVLTGDTGSQALYRERERQLRELGFHGSMGYFPETEQTCISISLTVGDEAANQKQLESVKMLLPHIKPITEGADKVKVKVLNISEHTLSEYCSYSLGVHEGREKPFIIRHNSFDHDEFATLEEAFAFIEKHYYYE